MKKHIAILGSTGSIGRQTLEVLSENPENFVVEVLTAGNNADLLIEQALEYRPKAVVIADESQYRKVNDTLKQFNINVLSGDDALCDVVQMSEIDVVVTALVGTAGLKPTFAAIEAGKDIALANKETLVVAGELILGAKNESITPTILPIDSEHSAIWQCLVGEENKNIEKILLTGSGGPFRGFSRGILEKVTKEQALKHPNWSMGAKITIDSASLMNKGLEVIEAKWLFDVDFDQIEVIIHPQSIIHSMLRFTDGSIKAQMGIPDMKLPIQYALSYPKRFHNNFKRLDFTEYSQLTFEKPDLTNFPCLALAYKAGKKGGNMPCILNAANEIAVQAFLEEKIKFLDMPKIIEKAMGKLNFVPKPSLNDLLDTDKETRRFCKTINL
jgi:1-deoxy-D-xylulose-5-phosphate reductoisomerase